MFATITYNIAIYTTNSYGMILVQRSPVYYGQTYVTSGYMMLLTLFVQLMGMGFAGYLRRFSVSPQLLFHEQSIQVENSRITFNALGVSCESPLADDSPHHCNEPYIDSP